ncbi:hypothetical protein ZIOFF_008576 [Zingiber officinale]|uniref:Uncharacterized protein n=1 Tax=Zingiber officinale TaxID=94328 RepID=A0A8J5M6U6_ZINOF|nr:hypothetical protein ZIOFF_008576 [Zingiber officinale]
MVARNPLTPAAGLLLTQRSTAACSAGLLKSGKAMDHVKPPEIHILFFRSPGHALKKLNRLLRLSLSSINNSNIEGLRDTGGCKSEVEDSTTDLRGISHYD